MKKVLSILLLIVMTFTIISCTVTPSTNTGTMGGETNTNTGGSSNTNSSGNSGYVPPILDYDSTKYEAKYADKNQTKIKYGSYSVKVPEITYYYNNYPAALSMTFDDGEDIAAAELAHEIMTEYGLKGTLMVNTGNIQGNLAKWQALVAKGTLDIGSHGWSHLDPSSISESQMEHEIKDSYDYLQENFPNENPVTYATPLSHLTSAYTQYLKNTGFIANRLEIYGTIVSKDSKDPDFYSLYAKRIDKGNPEINVRLNVSDSLSTGKWFIELYHNVRDRHSTDITEEDFRNHCKWLYDNYNGKVWFASYDDVAKYLVQRQTANIEYTDCDSESMTFLATVDKNYGQEMTLRLFVPFFIDSAYVLIDGEEQYVEVKKEAGVSNARVIYVNTEISEAGTEIKVMLGGNDKYMNNCNHAYVENEVVPSTEFDFGYTEMICTNCLHTYIKQYTDKLGDNATPSSIVYNGEELSAPSLTPYYNNYEAAISFTVDDGYDGNTATNIADVMDTYGMRCTAMLNPIFVEKKETIDKWTAAILRGCL